MNAIEDFTLQYLIDMGCIVENYGILRRSYL